MRFMKGETHLNFYTTWVENSICFFMEFLELELELEGPMGELDIIIGLREHGLQLGTLLCTCGRSKGWLGSGNVLSVSWFVSALQSVPSRPREDKIDMFDNSS